MLNLRLRQARDLLLSSFDLSCASTDVLKLREQVWSKVSDRIKSLAYTDADQFYSDCAPFLEAMAKVPALKQQQYMSTVLIKQIMVSSQEVESGKSSVHDAFQQLEENTDEPSGVSMEMRTLPLLFAKAATKMCEVANEFPVETPKEDQPASTYTELDKETLRILRVIYGQGKSVFSDNVDGTKPRSFPKVASPIGRTTGGLSLSRGPPSSAPSRKVTDSTSSLQSFVGESESTSNHAIPAEISHKLIGVTSLLNSEEVWLKDGEEGPEGEYMAELSLEEWGRVITLGKYSTPAEAARAHDRALMRAQSPKKVLPERLNYQVDTYKSDSLTLFTIHDALLRQGLFGTKWAGLQDCDFSFLITQRDKRSREDSPGMIGRQTKSTSDGAKSSIKGSWVVNFAKKAKTEVSSRKSVLSSDLTNYALPDIGAYLSEKGENEESQISPARPSRTTGRGRYRVFDAVFELQRCHDVPPLHAYILAQELTSMNAAVASSPAPNPPDPEHVNWSIYAKPYVPPERAGLTKQRDPDIPRNLPWYWCLNDNEAAEEALAEFRNNLEGSILLKAKEKKNMQERPELIGVQQLSTVHPVFIARLPENIYDNMSALSRDHDIGFGCFSYALEAAIIREQVLNPSGQASGARPSSARIVSNFTSNEWNHLKAASVQIGQLLDVHKIPATKSFEL